MKDFYEILGVASDSDADQIKKAYWRLAIRYHPDKNPGDAEAEKRFKELSNAYAILSNPEKRREYDATLASGLTWEEARAAAGEKEPDWSAEEFLRQFGDIFASHFGPEFQAARPATRPGWDAETALKIDFRTAALGGKVRVSVRGETTCAACAGRGSRGVAVGCPRCGGKGRVTGQAERSGQFFSVTQPCHACHGTGLAPGEHCPDCHGSGTREQARQLAITIPEGTADKSTLRLKGLGEAGRGGGSAGDLLVFISVLPDPEFRLEGGHIHSELSVPVYTAVLGGRVSVATLRGSVKLTIPPGSSSGVALRLKGQGVRGGDQVVHLRITAPKKLSPRERELYEELARLGASTVSTD